MIEAVGEAYWPSYFATIDRLLAPGGKVSIQAITMAHERVLATKQSFSWIQKYISPGGIIPSLQSIDETLATHTTLRVTERRELGAHYARTLHLWHDRFNEQWPRVHQLGFDETFRRMWEFYLAYCEAGFAVGHLGVSQLQMTREPPEFVRTDATAGNTFPMPFIIDAYTAGRAICDGLERGRTEIVFPVQMALLMKVARLVPVALWSALWSRVSPPGGS